MLRRKSSGQGGAVRQGRVIRIIITRGQRGTSSLQADQQQQQEDQVRSPLTHLRSAYTAARDAGVTEQISGRSPSLPSSPTLLPPPSLTARTLDTRHTGTIPTQQSLEFAIHEWTEVTTSPLMSEKGTQDLLEVEQEEEQEPELDMFDITTGAFLMLFSNLGCWTLLALDVPCYRFYVFAFYWLWAFKNRYFGPIWIDGGTLTFAFGVSAGVGGCELGFSSMQQAPG